jgi:hypothetical protein
MRKDGSAVTTHGVETQIYRKQAGEWRLVHVHYSEDAWSRPEHVLRPFARNREPESITLESRMAPRSN